MALDLPVVGVTPSPEWAHKLNSALTNVDGRVTSLETSPGGGGGSSAWDDITDKPATFPPSDHTHDESDVTGLTEALGAKADADATIGLGTGVPGAVFWGVFNEGSEPTPPSDGKVHYGFRVGA